jgi:predicted NAD/FAD-dependent oxidoreductase
LHARPVARIKLFGGKWIEAAEDFVQVFGPMFFANLIEATTEGLVSLWTDEEWLSQCAEIEASAADEDWNASTTLDFLDRFRCFARPFARGVVDRW